MIMPDDNIFRLQWAENSIIKTLDTTPLNWGGMEMGLQREFLAIKREVTSNLTFDREASEAIKAANNGNYPIPLTLLRRANDWTMTTIRTWSTDMTTYSTSRGMVSVGFKSSTAREEIEKNKGTKYEIPLGTAKLSYSGIDNDANNIISGIIGGGVRLSSSNYKLLGNHSTVEFSDTLTFAQCQVTSSINQTIDVRLKLGEVVIGVGPNISFDAKLKLYIWGPSGPLTQLASFDQNGSYIIGQFALAARFINDTELAFDNVPLLAGQSVVLFLNQSISNTTPTVFSCPDLRLSILSQEHSPYTDYKVNVDIIPTLISALLAKMCTAPPALSYNLTENANFQPLLTSAQGLSQTPNPIITLSFEDVMKCLFMLYGADYEVIDGAGDDLTLDIRPMTDLMSNVQAEVLDAVAGIECQYSSEHVYGTVKVGYETDENAKNGQYDPMCINTFKLGNSDEELDLVCPFKASPTTIEQFIRDKKTSSSTTKDSDTSVFLFCGYMGIDTYYHLYRDHTILSTPTPYVINDKFFNLAYSPMRILTNVGKYLKVSRWNITEPIEFISSERTARLDSDVTGVDSGQCSEDSASVDLQISMQYPLFEPFDVVFDAVIKPFTKAEINANPRKYYTVTDINALETYNLYINDLTLPLTKNVIGSFKGLRKYDMPT